MFLLYLTHEYLDKCAKEQLCQFSKRFAAFLLLRSADTEEGKCVLLNIFAGRDINDALEPRQGQPWSEFETALLRRMQPPKASPASGPALPSRPQFQAQAALWALALWLGEV